MNVLRGAASVLIAAALMAVGLGIGDAPGTRAEERRAPTRLFEEGEMPSFPNAFEFPLAERLTLNGSLIRTSYFVTSKHPEEVREFYRHAFEQSGLRTHIFGKEEESSIVAIDGEQGTTRVVAIRGSKEETWVFPTVLPTRATPVQISPGVDDEVPFDEDSVGALDVNSQGAESSRTVVYQEVRTIDVVEPRITSTLGRRNWVLHQRNQLREGVMLRFTRRGEDAVVGLQQGGGMPFTGVIIQFSTEEK
jgi:hypothetical protein